MPVHSLFITNGSGNVLFSKFFTKLSTSDEVVFQQLMFQHCSYYWTKESLCIKQTLTVKNVHILFQKIGDFIVFVNGLDDIDEPILITILDALAKMLQDTLENKLLETVFVNTEYYGKFVLSLEEMMPQGELELLDIELIGKLSKLKNL